MGSVCQFQQSEIGAKYHCALGISIEGFTFEIHPLIVSSTDSSWKFLESETILFNPLA